MLPPVAEIYVVWHPADDRGTQIAEYLLDHFHGTPFTGLIGGAVEVNVRSAAWQDPDPAPRPIPLPGRPPPNLLPLAQLVAVVPVLGTELVAAVEDGGAPWHRYAAEIAAARAAYPSRVGVFPLVLDRLALDSTRVGRLLGRFQNVGPLPTNPRSVADLAGVCRDLAQGIAQLADDRADDRLTVFISHTKGEDLPGQHKISELIRLARSIIRETRLNEFFDAHSVQPGQDWRQEISSRAASSAMLAVRTDQYASRTWCQREMLAAKCAGMPVVILDALGRGDDRGSFLMDHVPRIPVGRTSSGGGWQPQDVNRGLARLVDECLKRALWRRQQLLASGRRDLKVAWWAPHAPEPATLVAWLADHSTARMPGQPLRILHPDPPLGPDELAVLQRLASLDTVAGGLEIMTPRTLAARGG